MSESSSGLDLPVDESLLAFIDEVRKTVDLSVGQKRELLGPLTEKLKAYNRELEGNYDLPEPSFAKSPQHAVEVIHNNSAGGGRYNPLASPGKVEFDDGKVTRWMNLPYPYHGPGKLVHGGVISMIYDDLFAITTSLNNIRAQTVQLEVKYHGPTLVQSDIRFTAEVAERDGRKITMRGQCWYKDKLLTEASALFIEVKPKS